MKLIACKDGILINAEAIDYIDIQFDDDGNHLYIYLSLHGIDKRICYKNTNDVLLKVNDGKSFRTSRGIIRCDVDRNQNRCVNFIRCEIINYLQKNDVNILYIDFVVREVMNDNEKIFY